MVKIAIVGWHEGTAGVTDSWLNSIGVEVSCFISITNDHNFVDKSIHKKFGNPKFSYPQNNTFKNRPLVFDPHWYTNHDKYQVQYFLISEADPPTRSSQIELALKSGVKLYSAIHPSAQILDEVNYGVNCIFQAGSIIGYKSVIGNGVFINTGSIIDHHVVLEDYVTINPGCVLAGNIRVKSRAVLHSGVVVKNKIIIGHDSIIGAGSVVIKDVEKHSKVVGVPGRKIE
jgi:serine O-acetyltransferase